MRFLAVFLPRLSTDRLLRPMRRSGAAPDAPFAVYGRVKGAERLTGVCARAAAQGLYPGMAAADARALRPDLRLAEADPRADAEMLERLADWSRRFTPLAALDPPSGLLLDISGAAHLFGGEAALLADIVKRLGAQGFSARGAIAPGPALASALARFAPRIVKPGAAQAEIDALAGALPVAALGLPQAEPLLARAGLSLIGDLLARPRAPLAARFGHELAARLDRLACRARDPIAPRFEAPDFMAERRFPEGLAQHDAIENVLAMLAADLALLLERSGVGARSLEALFFRVDGAVKRLCVGAGRPVRDPARLAALLKERLSVVAEEGLDTGYGFDVFRLSALETERLDPPQPAFADVEERAAHGEEAFADLLDRLSARLGARRVLRLHPQETHIPELAVAAVPAAYGQARDWSEARVATEGPRPLRLFETPEPVEAIAMTPDGPPLRFRWRRMLHEVVAFEGPERIAPQWWAAEAGAPTRDYFFAQDREGRLFWLFRDGLYGLESVAPRWFLHGLS